MPIYRQSVVFELIRGMTAFLRLEVGLTRAGMPEARASRPALNPENVVWIFGTARTGSWENIPAERKGEGKFNRKATPGAWKDDLTREQARVVEEITEPVLEEFYPARESRARDGSREDRCQRSGIARPSS